MDISERLVQLANMWYDRNPEEAVKTLPDIRDEDEETFKESKDFLEYIPESTLRSWIRSYRNRQEFREPYISFFLFILLDTISMLSHSILLSEKEIKKYFMTFFKDANYKIQLDVLFSLRAMEHNPIRIFLINHFDQLPLLHEFLAEQTHEKVPMKFFPISDNEFNKIYNWDGSIYFELRETELPDYDDWSGPPKFKTLEEQLESQSEIPAFLQQGSVPLPGHEFETHYVTLEYGEEPYEHIGRDWDDDDSFEWSDDGEPEHLDEPPEPTPLELLIREHLEAQGTWQLESLPGPLPNWGLATPFDSTYTRSLDVILLTTEFFEFFWPDRVNDFQNLTFEYAGHPVIPAYQDFPVTVYLFQERWPSQHPLHSILANSRFHLYTTFDFNADLFYPQ